MTKLTLFLMPVILAAQPAFEAATVKPADPQANGFSTRMSATAYELRNCSLRQCIETAYGLPEYAVIGPSWLESVHFDVVAKLPMGAPRRDIGAMLQGLLAERLQLQTHTETRDVPGFVLTVAKGGPRMPESAPDSMGGTSRGPSTVRCRHCEVARFIEELTGSLGRPVVDQTSLPGVYDFDVRWTPDRASAAPGEAAEPTTSLFSAMEEQLGLKLQARKVPQRILVVDSAVRAPVEK